jgi:DNA-binding LytR/AlgR family response regulator
MKTFTKNYLGEACKLARNMKLCVNEVLYCEGEANYTHIHLIAGKPKMLARTLLIVETRIASESFVRISRKHLVNRKFITEIGDDYVVMSNDKILPISRRKRGRVYHKFGMPTD